MIEQIRNGLLFYIILIVSLCLHEWGHALVADRLGEKRPRLEGRLSLNPLVHMDLLGSVVFPLAIIFGNILMGIGGAQLPLFAWGKPVNIDLTNPKKRARNEILIALAGPLTNFLITLIVASVGIGLTAQFPQLRLEQLCSFIIFVNAALTIINLLPVPPFDGGALLRHAFRMSEFAYLQWTRWSILLILAIIMIPPLRAILEAAIMLAAYPAHLLLHRF